MAKTKEKLKGIKIYIRADTEQRFRRAAMATYGYGKGALSEAGEAALEHWSACASTIQISDIKDPISAIEGMLSHVKKNSVDVQHEIPKLRSKKVMHYAKKR